MRRIFETMEAYYMIEAGSRVITGVSGGADSVCLLYALKEYGKKVPFECLAVHVEHGLRGEESLADARFVEELCREWGISCRTVQIRVRELAAKQGLSEEEAGRLERYRIFEEIRQEEGAQCIAVAHNQNDQAETVLHHLARGSSLKGLCGIRPVRGTIIRPLLYLERKEIEQILCVAGIPWRTDRTNLEQEYTRNRIRLSVLPQLEREVNMQATAHIAQAAKRLLQVQEYLERVTRRAEQACIMHEALEDNGEQDSVKKGGAVRESNCVKCAVLLSAFFEEDELIQQELLKRALELCQGQKDIGAVHIEALMALARMDCGKELCLPGGVRAVREAGKLCFIRAGGCAEKNGQVAQKREGACRVNQTGKAADGDVYQQEFELTSSGTYDTPDWEVDIAFLQKNCVSEQEIIKEKKYTKWLSYDTIKDTVVLRTRRKGDYLVVNGQGGKKKLKDYLIDCKVPREQRDRLWLLADGSHVLWVAGYRISEAAKVTKTTEKVIKIQLKEKRK